MSKGDETVIIGLGGIGSIVGFGLSYSLQRLAEQETVRITLVDGGYYRWGHRDHEHFDELGNKAKVQRRKLSTDFPAIFYRSVPLYVAEHDGPTARAVARVIEAGCWLQLAVDNHTTRRLVSDHCQTLESATVISGSNDGADTCTLQVYIRRNARDVTPPLTDGHPHIAQPRDRSPVDVLVNGGCEDLVTSGRQLPATLFACASLMLNAFHTARRLEATASIDLFPYREIYWDIARAKYRVVTTESIRGG